MNVKDAYRAYWFGLYNKSGSSCKKPEKEQGDRLLADYLRKVGASPNWKEATEEQMRACLNLLLDHNKFMIPEHVRNVLERAPNPKKSSLRQHKADLNLEDEKAERPAPIESNIDATSQPQENSSHEVGLNEAPEEQCPEPMEAEPSPVMADAEVDDIFARKDEENEDIDEAKEPQPVEVPEIKDALDAQADAWNAPDNDQPTTPQAAPRIEVSSPPARQWTAPSQEKKAAPGNPFDFDPLDYSADYYLTTQSKEPEFITHYRDGLKCTGSIQPGTQSVIFGCPGTGKSQDAIQGAVALSACVPWAGAWYPDRSRKVLYLGAEDDDDVVHRRVKAALMMIPEEARKGIGARLCAKSVRSYGSLNLFKGEGANTVKTDMFDNLFGFVERYAFEVVILDTLGCFMPFAAKDDVGLSTAGAWIDAECSRLRLALIWIWHALKAAGQYAKTPDELKNALSLPSMKFGPAFSGRIRWAKALAPLDKDYVAKIIGPEAKQSPSGTYIAARVVKKNEGAPEDTIFLRHDEDTGMLHREIVEESDAHAPSAPITVRGLAQAITDEVRRRYEENDKYLTKSTPWSCETFVSAYEGRKMPPHSQWKDAVAFAIESGMLGEAKKASGNGVILIHPDDPAFDELVASETTPENVSKKASR